jgi:hypothetical protein
MVEALTPQSAAAPQAHPKRRLDLAARLQVHPQFGPGPQDPVKLERGVGADTDLFGHDALDPRPGDPLGA